MGWYDILKAVSDRERLDAELYAPEEMEDWHSNKAIRWIEKYEPILERWIEKFEQHTEYQDSIDIIRLYLLRVSKQPRYAEKAMFSIKAELSEMPRWMRPEGMNLQN